MTITAQQAQQVLKEADCLYTAEQVEQAFDKLAELITQKLEHSDPLILCVMTGGVVPVGHLLPRLPFPLQLDYIHATRYKGKTVGGALHWHVKPEQSLEGRVILVIDDILDEGYTLKAIIDACRQAGAQEIYSAVLVDKQHDRKADIKADFVGLEVPDRYVFGYGMDYKAYLRNAPGIYAEKK